MQPDTYNQTLLDQIAEAFGNNSAIPDNLTPLLKQVSGEYTKLQTSLEEARTKIALRTQQLVASTSGAYSFLDSLNLGFIMCDLTSEIVLTNSSIKNILESKNSTQGDHSTAAPIKEWTISAVDELFEGEVSIKELVNNCLETGRPVENKSVNYGQRVLHLFLAPMVNEAANDSNEEIGVVILIEDITEQKALERSKDDFLSVASHELRTPLTAIRGNTSILQKYYSDNDFLDASSLEQKKIKIEVSNFPIIELVKEVVRDMQNLCAEKGIYLRVDEISEQLNLMVSADKQRVKQVVYNFIGNAIKFTEKGDIMISLEAQGKFVCVYVKDTGRGISAEAQHLLFRKFQQAGNDLLTRDTTKGTGLGLYISRLIIELSGGKIGLLQSEEGIGSTFFFTLPLAQ
jgi:signal transduction histidine kinase